MLKEEYIVISLNLSVIMSPGISILIVIGISLLVLLGWNILSLRRLYKSSHTIKELNDSRYYELKYKQEFIIAIVSVIGTILVVFGYNSIHSVEKALSDEFNSKTEATNAKMNIVSNRSDSLIRSFDSALNIRLSRTNNKLASIEINSASLATETEKNLKKVQSSVNSYNNSLESLKDQQYEIENRNITSDQKMKEIINRITELNNKNILKQNYYLVDSLYFDIDKYFMAGSDELQYATYYFKDMHTTLGDKLPHFSKPPFIILSTDGGGSSSKFKNITTDSFKFKFESYMDGTPRMVRFSILISELQ